MARGARIYQGCGQVGVSRLDWGNYTLSTGIQHAITDVETRLTSFATLVCEPGHEVEVETCIRSIVAPARVGTFAFTSA